LKTISRAGGGEIETPDGAEAAGAELARSALAGEVPFAPSASMIRRWRGDDGIAVAATPARTINPMIPAAARRGAPSEIRLAAFAF